MLSVRYESRSEDWKRAAKAIEGTIYAAARAAFQDLAKQVQSQIRAQIAGAGFKGKWVSGFRTYIFPKNPEPTLDLTVRGFHSYNIANVFERGAKVSGRPLLWVPLSTAPKSVRGKPTTAARLIAAGVRLHKVNSGAHQLLVGMVIRSAAGSRRKSIVGLRGGKLLVRSGQVTVQQLLNGQRNVRRSQARAAFGGRGPQSVSIPLFIGLNAIEIKKRFNASAVYERGRDDLEGFYSRRLAELNK